MIGRYVCVCILGGLSSLVVADDSLPAFPGAEGFGATTPGGRGGRVVEVSTLDDDGPGSLRSVIDLEGARTVVFRVGGTIELSSPLQIKHPFITIAGQTAPGGGITLRNGPQNLYAPLQIKTHDVVLRYIRSRPGPSGVPPAEQDGTNVDALTIADLQSDVHHVVVDHCSFSWSVDEVVTATGTVDLVNNVMLVPRTIAVVIDGELGPCHVNLVGNHVLAPNGDGIVYGARVLGHSPVSLFVQGNRGPFRTDDAQPESLFVAPQNDSRNRLVAQRAPAPAITTTSAEDATAQVLTTAGCTVPIRDAVDERVVADVIARRTRIISDPAEVGGWPNLPSAQPAVDSDHDGMPDEWEHRHGLAADDPSDATRDADGDGYTNVEAFLNQLVD